MTAVVFRGFIISSQSLQNLEVLNGFITVENGKIRRKGTKAEYEDLQAADHFHGFETVDLGEEKFLMPGFVDCHTHAPQFPNIGLGLDRPLLEWLDKYTFPLESQYSNEEFAIKVYDMVVRRLLKNGTTTACYFGTIDMKGTLQLVECVRKYQQRALIGKVSMNIKNDAGYYQETSKEIPEVETYIQKVLDMKSDLIEPIITPRFAVSCDSQLMTGLSSLARKYDCRIQSHISENHGEIQHVLKTNPESKSYAEVYDKSEILTNKCIMAHAVHLSEDEMQLLSQRGVSVAHCPASNTRLMSGLCPVRQILDHGITTGLGTDVSGGDSASLLDAIRRAMDVSAHLQLLGSAGAALSWREAFYLATLGGAKALNLDSKIGNFVVGKDFDALLVSPYSSGAVDKYPYSVAASDSEVAENLLQRFLYLGDDRNIEKVFVKGVETKARLL